MIYFIQAQKIGSIKIGYTDGLLTKRVPTIQTGCPFGLRVLGVLPGGQDKESQLHHQFAAYRMEGEWFEPVPLLMRYILDHAIPWDTSLQDFIPLVELCPALGDLWKTAYSYRDRPQSEPFCANVVWYHDPALKMVLCSLVGFDAPKKSLRTTKAYDIAYDAVYQALPDCRECGCLTLQDFTG